MKFTLGSTNYHINTKESDIDYLHLELPKGKDILLGKQIKNSQSVSNEIDITTKDLRTIRHMFENANLNSLEILWSKEYSISNEYAYLYLLMKELGVELMQNKLFRLVKSTLGEYNNGLKQLERNLKPSKFFTRVYIKLDALIYLSALQALTIDSDEFYNYISNGHKHFSHEELRSYRKKDNVPLILIDTVKDYVRILEEQLVEGTIKENTKESFEELFEPIELELVEILKKHVIG